MNSAEIEPGLRRQFVLSGNATFTLVGRGARYTYRVERSKKLARERFVAFWVYVLRGSNNDTDYAFLGGVTSERFYVSSKSRLREDSPSAVAFAWFWKHAEDPRVTVLHSGSCGRCGRLLTTPESIRLGLGPECAKMAAAG